MNTKMAAADMGHFRKLLTWLAPNRSDNARPGARTRWLGPALAATVLAAGTPLSAARPQKPIVDIVPTISAINIVNGQLVASGTVRAVLDSRTYTTAFSGVPVNLALAADQTGAGACPILDLSLGAITVDLLGLVVETSPICLRITAYENGQLLGELLCAVADLLGGGLTLNQVLAGQGLIGPVTLPGLTATQIGALTAGLVNLLNEALDNLLAAVLLAFVEHARGPECAILNLTLGRVELTLLGLEVELDNCANGPVTVDITAVRGALLGNLLCSLLGSGNIAVGDLLSEIVNQLLRRV